MSSASDEFGDFEVKPLPGANFGRLIAFGVADGEDYAAAFVDAAERHPEALPAALASGNGLMLIRGMDGISAAPELLARLSRLFGSEVENYHQTLTSSNMVHETVPEIFIVSNMAPVNRTPPPQPDPPYNPDGSLPTRFPHRRGWHTDQSYRRPPPDISLFFASIASQKGQGQTLFANGVLAYESLPERLKARVDDLIGIHAKPRSGRSETAVRAGETPDPLKPHERPQHQPVVRTHPVTGKKALYLCEAGQMDWVQGPFVGMEAGPDGDGAALLYEIMSHYTQPDFSYAHDWDVGDLVVWDNRCLIHAATWFDAENQDRLMWRTTVRGNPGAEYAGESKSWIPKDEAPAPAG